MSDHTGDVIEKLEQRMTSLEESLQEASNNAKAALGLAGVSFAILCYMFVRSL